LSRSNFLGKFYTHVKNGKKKFVNKELLNIKYTIPPSFNAKTQDRILKNPINDLLKNRINDLLKNPINDLLKNPINDLLKIPINDLLKIPINDLLKITINDLLKIPINDRRTRLFLHRFILGQIFSIMQENQILRMNNFENVYFSHTMLNFAPERKYS